MKDLLDLLSRLGEELDLGVIDLPAAAQAVAESTCAALACSQVSVWLLASEPHAGLLHRIAGFDAHGGRGLDELRVAVDADIARGLDALRQSSVLVCDDVVLDRRIVGMQRRELFSDDLRSLMVATLGANGVTRGLICCEQRAVSRRWHPSEVTLLKRLADEVSLRRARRRAREAVAEDSCAQWLGSPTAEATAHPASAPGPGQGMTLSRRKASGA